MSPSVLYFGVVATVAALMLGCGAGRGEISAKSAQPELEAKRLDFGKVIMDAGWDIPELSNAVTMTARKSVEGPSATEGLFITVLKPELPPINEQKQFPQLLSFDVDKTNVLHVLPHRVRVHAIERYDFAGKLFRYKVYLSDVAGSADTPQVTARIYSVYFQDEDGNGTFESYYNPAASDSQLLMPTPDWVKK